MANIPTGFRQPRVALRGMGSQAMPLALANPPSAPADATDCSVFDFFFDPTAWKACATAAEVAQIQTVPTNAAIYYPDNPAVQQAAQIAAEQQSAQAPQDVGTIYNDWGSGSVAIPSWAWIAAVAIGAGILWKALS